MIEKRFSSFAIHLLCKHHPAVAQSIKTQIDEAMPVAVLTDLDDLPMVVKAFCNATNLNDIVWSKSRKKLQSVFDLDAKPSKTTTELREILLAVIILLYQPEKLYNFVDSYYKQGLLKGLSRILGVNNTQLCHELANLPTHFAAYKNFNNQVIRSFNMVVDQLKGSKFQSYVKAKVQS